MWYYIILRLTYSKSEKLIRVLKFIYIFPTLFEAIFEIKGLLKFTFFEKTFETIYL